MSISHKASTIMFVCDVCGVRKPLDKTKRHWCEHLGVASVEMRCTRDRKPPAPATFVAPLARPAEG